MISTNLRTKLKSPGVIKLLALFFWLALWQLVSAIAGNSLILPSPVETFKIMGQVIVEPGFFVVLGMTLLRVFSGVIISVILGMIFGFIGSVSPVFRGIMDPFVTIIRTVPVVSVIILINLWVAAGWVPLIIAFLICFPIAWTNTLEGIANVSPGLLKMAKVYRVPFKRVVQDIYIPSLKPYFAAALINAIGMGWKATVTAEVLANALPSVGMNLYYAKIYLETPELFAWTAIIIICSYGIEKITKYLLDQLRSGENYDY